MGNWELSYPGETLAFGTHDSGLGFVGAPEIGSPETLNGDVQAALGDGRLFGVDRLGGGLVTFELDAYCATEEEARGRLERARRAWRADAIRRTPGAVAQLTSGRGRSTFGRPRRFSSVDTQIANGFVSILADFATATDLWFGAEQVDSVTFAPSTGGGFTFPVTFPMSMASEADRSQAIRIGGETPTQHLVFEIAGPITNPSIEVVGVARLDFVTTLAYDEVMIVDARPWVRSITVNGNSRAGSLTPASTSLSRLTLPPGSHEIALRGTDITGTSSLTTRWRDAYTTP